jgi:hypothetical protein
MQLVVSGGFDSHGSNGSYGLTEHAYSSLGVFSTSVLYIPHSVGNMIAYGVNLGTSSIYSGVNIASSLLSYSYNAVPSAHYLYQSIVYHSELVTNASNYARTLISCAGAGVGVAFDVCTDGGTVVNINSTEGGTIVNVDGTDGDTIVNVNGTVDDTITCEERVSYIDSCIDWLSYTISDV